MKKNSGSSQTTSRGAVQGNREDEQVSVEHGDPIEELSGSLDRNPDEDKLLHTIMENDDQTIKDGRLLEEAANVGARISWTVLSKSLLRISLACFWSCSILP